MKTSILIIALVAGLSSQTFPQQNKIDSLKLLLKPAKQDTQMLYNLNELTRALWKISELDSSMSYADKAIAVSEKMLSHTEHLKLRRAIKKGQGRAYLNKAIIYDQTGNYSEALRLDSIALKISLENEDQKEIANVFHNIGIVFYDQSNYDEALKNFLIALNKRKEINDKEGIAASYNSIGNINLEQGSYADALKSYLQALKLNEELNDKEGVAKAYYNIGLLYSDQGDDSSAMNYFTMSLELYQVMGARGKMADVYNSLGELCINADNNKEALRYFYQALHIFEEIGEQQGAAISYDYIGTVYSFEGKYTDALQKYKESLRIAKEIDYYHGVVNCFLNIGDLYHIQKEYLKAESYLDSGLALSIDIGSFGVTEQFYLSLSRLSEEKRDYRQALEYYKAYSDAKDSLFNEANNESIAQMKTQYETEKKDQQITLLNKDKELALANTRREVILRNSFIVGTVLFLLLAFLWFYRFREKRKALALLQQTQTQLVQSEKMASLGQLTAGVAHEINNPINFVSANIKPLKRNVDDLLQLINQYETTISAKQLKNEFKEVERFKKDADLDTSIAEVHELINGIEMGAARTAQIVKGLRNFSRIDEDALKEADINEGLESTLAILQNKLNHQSIEVVKFFGDLPGTECFPGPLNQVFMNIIANAIDAVDSKGKIFITTSSENNQVKISIRDTGKGMTEKIKQHIFDPFFTTKDVGKGTGLGLSISYGIIEKHHGNIEVKSELGKGTEFIILLPARQNK